ncbi:MAG: hypothetical protein GQ564_08505 [Bacteroidales bacterium]|nr:hypothetical protein [Bacteroidales bacterium]
MTHRNKFIVKLIHCGNNNPVNLNDKAQKNMFFMPMGLLMLAEALNKENYDVEVIHSDIETDSLDDILDFNNINAIGFDCHWINQSLAILETAKYIKEKNSSIFIFLGGFSASLFYSELLTEYDYFDAIIKGDGEKPLLELCKVLSENLKEEQTEVNLDLKSVSNLVWRENGNVIDNKTDYIASSQDVEDYTFAKFDLLKNWEFYRDLSNYYSHFKPISEHPMYLLEIGRGCENSCAYCGGNSVAQEKINNRSNVFFRSISSVIESIKESYSYGFRVYYFSLECKESDEYYQLLFQEIKKLDLPIYVVYGAWRLPSANIIDQISACCEQSVLEISPETSNELLRKKNKDNKIYFSNTQLEECLSHIKSKQNIKAQIFFGYYLSGDSKETILSTIEYILHLLASYNGMVEIEYSNFSTDPGSLYFFKPESYDINISTRNFDDYITNLKRMYVDNSDNPADMTLFRPNTISEEESQKIFLLMRIFNYIFITYRNTITLYFEETGEINFLLNLINKFDTKNLLNYDSKLIQDIFDELFSIFKPTGEEIRIVFLSEFEKSHNSHTISRPTTQLFMDSELAHQFLERCDRSILTKYQLNIEGQLAEQKEKDQGDFNF